MRRNVFDPQSDDVVSSELAVDGPVKHGQGALAAVRRTAGLTSKADCSGLFGIRHARRWSQVLFGEFAEFVGNKTGGSQCERPVPDGLPPKAAADPVDSAVDHPTLPPPFGAGTALLIFESKREFQLHYRALFQL